MNSKSNASAPSQNKVNRQTTPAFRTAKSNVENPDQQNNNNNDTSKNQGSSVQSQIEKYQTNITTDKPSGQVTPNSTLASKKTNLPGQTINQRTESSPNLKYLQRPTSDPPVSTKTQSNPSVITHNGTSSTSMLRSNSNDSLSSNTSTNRTAHPIKINSDTGTTIGKSNNVRATIDTTSLPSLSGSVSSLKTSFEAPQDSSSKTTSSPAKPSVKATQPEPSKNSPVALKSSQSDPPKTTPKSTQPETTKPQLLAVKSSQVEATKIQPAALKSTQSEPPKQSKPQPFSASKSMDSPKTQPETKPQQETAKSQPEPSKNSPVALKSTQSELPKQQPSPVKTSQPAAEKPEQPDLVKPSTLRQTPVKSSQDAFYKPQAFKTEPAKSNTITKSPSAPTELTKSTPATKTSEPPKSNFYTQNVKQPGVVKLFPTTKQSEDTQHPEPSNPTTSIDEPIETADPVSTEPPSAEAEPAPITPEPAMEEPEPIQLESTPSEATPEPLESPREAESPRDVESPRSDNSTPDLPPDESENAPSLPPSPRDSPTTSRKKPQRPSRSATMFISSSSNPLSIFDSRDSSDSNSDELSRPIENAKVNDAKLYTIRKWMKDRKKQNKPSTTNSGGAQRRRDLRIARQLSEVEIKKLEGQLTAELVLVVLPPLESQNVNVKKVSGFCKLQITMSQETSLIYKSAFHFQKLHQKIEENFPDLVKESSLALPKFVRDGKMECLFDPQGRKDLQAYVDLVVAQTPIISHPLFEDFLDPSIMPVLISTAEGDREGVLRVSTTPLRWHERWGVIKWRHFYVYKDQDDIGSIPSLAVDLQAQMVTVEPGVSGTVSNSSKEQTVFDVTLWSDDKTCTYKGKDERDRNQWILTLRAIKCQRFPGSSYASTSDSFLEQSHISRLLFDYAAADSSYESLSLSPYQIDNEPIPSDRDCDANFIFSAQKQQIKGGTVEKLIEKLCDNQQGMDFVHTFLLTYRSFTTPQHLLVACVKRFYSQTSAADSPIHPIQLRVCTVLSKWVAESINDFSEDDKLTSLLISFIEVDLLQNTKFVALGKKLKEAVKKKVFKQRNLSLIGLEFPDPELPILFHHAPESWDFIDIPPIELARQFTLIEFDLFKKIQPKECLKIKDKEKHAPNILAVIKRFNKMSSWVVTQIVKAEDFKARVALVSRLIEIAHHCILLNNYNTGMEIMSAFNASPIFRLQKTWDGLSSSIASMLNSMKQLLGSANNYKVYREKLHTIQPPCVPYFGVYLTDLTFVEEGNSDKLDNGLINFEKNFLFYKVIKEIKLYQQTPYVFKTIEPIRQYFSQVDELGPLLDENEAYNLSLKVEPRDS